MELLILEVAQAETRMHVDLALRSQGSEFGSGTFGVGHAHVRHRAVLFGKQEHKHTAILSHQCQCHRLQECARLRDQT